MSYGWPDDETKVASIRKKRRASASHGTVDLEKVTPPSDELAHAAARIVAGHESTDVDGTRHVLDMLGILKQVRGEPDPDRYLAHCEPKVGTIRARSTSELA